MHSFIRYSSFAILASVGGLACSNAAPMAVDTTQPTQATVSRTDQLLDIGLDPAQVAPSTPNAHS
jgi:hypothetical protein